MGCDIHMYVERRPPTGSWWSWPRINPGRDYGVFGALAGVRGGPALIEPRGIPHDIGHYASGDWWVLIDDEFAEHDGWCSREQAERWSQHGSILEIRNGKAHRVEHPDWHTPSWLNADEFEAALNANQREREKWPIDPDYWAVVAALREFEKRGYESRAVFWFDN